jgi:hypothetical protein
VREKKENVDVRKRGKYIVRNKDINKKRGREV